jgi:hypothetical protein
MIWTPINKQLPPVKVVACLYYVTILSPEGRRYVKEGTYCYKNYNHPSDNWRFLSYDGEEYDIEDYGTIVAWMPVPEMPSPYEGT